jgi:hypothetical protein
LVFNLGFTSASGKPTGLQTQGFMAMFPTLAILDFGLNEKQIHTLLCEGLEFVARHEKYSLRELIGTLLVLKKPELRARENLLARERSAYCSAFVKNLFHKLEIDLVPGVASKNTAPEDLAHSPLPHVKYLLRRDMPGANIAARVGRLKKHVRSRLQKIRRPR